MRKGRFSAVFLVAVSLTGLLIGGVISLVLSSLSTDWAFVVVVSVSIVLALVASSARAARDNTDKQGDVRDVTAVVPLDGLVQEKRTAAASDQPKADSSSK